MTAKFLPNVCYSMLQIKEGAPTKLFHRWESSFTLIMPEGDTAWKWLPESLASEVQGPEPFSFELSNLYHTQQVTCPQSGSISPSLNVPAHTSDCQCPAYYADFS